MTDSSTVPADLRRALDGMRDENDRIAPDQPAFTVAYLLPIPDPDDEANGAPEVLAQYGRELDGVLRAQRRADDTSTLNGPVPKVRIAVYNIGTDGALWVRALNGLQSRLEADHVVAAVAPGPGLQSTGALAEALIDLSIPVFTSRATAVQLTARHADPRGLLRPLSTSTRLATTAAAALGGDRGVQIVQDIRADNLDAADLVQYFSAAVGGTSGPALTYDSSQGPAGTDFSTKLARRCPAGTRTNPAFFVAGRGPQIAEFLINLNASPCQGQITVLAGPDGAQLLEQLNEDLRQTEPDLPAQQLIAAFRSPKFRFLYLGLGHPDLWVSAPFDQRYIDTIKSFPERGTDAERWLQGGDDIVGYDATIAAITCARRAGDQYRLVPSARTVLDTCADTTSPLNPVYGAAGAIGFDPQGRATDVLVPVVLVNADGTARVIGG